jgi:Flp pilus assembly protein TadD
MKSVCIKKCGILVLWFMLPLGNALGTNAAFTNLLARADRIEKDGNLAGMLMIYGEAQRQGAGNAGALCELAKRYCDLTYLTASKTAQKDCMARALACAEQAVKDDPQSATAHTSLAICYAKSCMYADIKGQLTYSRAFKAEAEKAITLDPRQDLAYYLLGRWNYGMAGIGRFSRAYARVVYGGLPKASFQDAVLNFRKAVELSPNRVINHAGLAMAYEAVGENKQAVVEWQKCCAMTPLGPEDLEARQDAEKKLAGSK